MNNNIESRVTEYNINLKIKNVEGEIKINGKIAMDFECGTCKGICHYQTKYDINSSQKEYKCPDCQEEYLITNAFSVIPKIKEDKIKQ